MVKAYTRRRGRKQWRRRLSRNEPAHPPKLMPCTFSFGAPNGAPRDSEVCCDELEGDAHCCEIAEAVRLSLGRGVNDRGVRVDDIGLWPRGPRRASAYGGFEPLGPAPAQADIEVCREFIRRHCKFLPQGFGEVDAYEYADRIENELGLDVSAGAFIVAAALEGYRAKRHRQYPYLAVFDMYVEDDEYVTREKAHCDFLAFMQSLRNHPQLGGLGYLALRSNAFIRACTAPAPLMRFAKDASWSKEDLVRLARAFVLWHERRREDALARLRE